MINRLYIRNRQDGLVGSGTLEEPYDGSTILRFESAMKSAGANTRIFIGPGTYETSGYTEGIHNIMPRDGWHVRGAGIDKTIIKMVNANSGVGTSRKIVFGLDWNTYAHNSIFERFTLDCNADGQPTTDGICADGFSFRGNFNTIREVKVINCGSRRFEVESFPISMGGVHHLTQQYMTGCVLDSCVVQQLITTGIRDGITCMMNNSVGAIIKNCYVDCQGYTGYNHAYSALYGLVSGNRSDNAEVGFYDDSSISNDITVIDNDFINGQYGVQYNLHTTIGNLRTGYYINNRISFPTYRTYSGDHFYGFKFLGKHPAQPNPWAINYVLVSGNSIYCEDNIYKTGSPNQLAYLAYFYNVKTGAVFNNETNIYSSGHANFRSQITFTAGPSGETIISGNNYSSVPILINNP